ncbi:hypothetical protein Tco_0242610 [Tanacetum coccineum]
MLQQRIFESGSHRTYPDHENLYEALDRSIARDNQDELHETFSSKQQPVFESGQPTDDIPTSDKEKILDSDDNDNAHVPKVKPRAEWLKPVPKEDRPASPEPEGVIPLNELPEVENNWTDALAETYRDPDENKLISKTGDMARTQLMEECHLLLTDHVDLVNLEGHRIVPNVSELLPLGGPPGQVEVRVEGQLGISTSGVDTKGNQYEDGNLLPRAIIKHTLGRGRCAILNVNQTCVQLERNDVAILSESNWGASRS